METLISILVALLGGVGFLYYRKSKENVGLKADIDLTSQRERSKIADEKVSDADEKLDALGKEMDKPVEESDEFWKKYKR